MILLEVKEKMVICMIEILLIFVGFIATFIGTLAGGGGMISLPAMLVIGVPIHSAIAANKFSNTFSSFSSFIVLLKEKKINFTSALIIAPFSLIGGITGGAIASSLSQKYLTLFAILLLSFALLLSLKKKPKTTEGNTTKKIPKRLLPYLYGVGIYDGMFGPGQATLSMFTYLHHGFSFMASMAFTRFQTFLSCLGAVLMYVSSGHFELKVALFLGIGSIIGAQVSVRIANNLPTRHLQMILRIVTVLLIFYLLIKFIV
jgi:uncharacterized protein